ncbi:PREDICTED: uncharacterized protein LOC109466860 isoform X1 [Branchiostoma belcheri]|uniref:Uncharacterized protein LOC109466860 isoform X1 n=1 Tax=Branchiostoma belcheri TaxID=7741 RepID=A0A6P4YDU4_BRABE|nr:PREDICTED: uncharacterized protein LOC109466860 isoform X1 [Branchiostoma belcheri]
MSYGETRTQDGGYSQPQSGGDFSTAFPPQPNAEAANRSNCGGNVYPANVPYHQPMKGVQSNGGHPGQAHPLAPAYPPISHQPVPTNKGVMVHGAHPANQNARHVHGPRQRTNDSSPYICCCVMCAFPTCDCDCDCCDGCDCDLM